MKNPVTVLLLLKRVDCNDGVASYCETLINGLNARGDRVVIVSGPVTELYGSSSRRNALAEGAHDWVVIDDFRPNRPIPSVIRRLLKTIQTYSVDVISPQGLSLLPLTFLLSKLSGRPVIANYHPSMMGKTADKIATRHSFLTKLSYRFIATFFGPDRIIAISKDVASFFEKGCGIKPRQISYIPHGVDIVAYRPPSAHERQQARDFFSISKNTLVCELSGRLNFVKGHDIVIDAIRILRKTKPELKVVCLFAGAGDQGSEIQAYAKKDGNDPEAFRFLGFLGLEPLRDVYWAADLALMPSRFESYGLVMAEAMSCGCVPIRTPSGGWQDQIIDGDNGFLIPFNDPQALADRIAELSDPDLLARMREKAINYARENFSQEKMIASTSDLYRSVVT